MIFVFYILACVLIYFSYQSFRGGMEYLAFFRAALAKPLLDYQPPVSVVAPCRGLDQNLPENLRALFRQNYPRYEIIFVVDDAADEAAKIIREVSAQYANIAASKLIIAGKSVSESRKVHNLREAVTRTADESKIFVFVDSDARPDENWLANLVAPLADKKIGAATGYRWFISKNSNFASELRAAWNASIASALGANEKNNFVWGGSTAIRREVFEHLEIREKWRGTASDDFTITRTLQAAGMPIVFVPQALTASVENCNFGEMLEFTTRQMKITCVYAAHLWLQSLLGAGLFNAVFVWGIGILIVARIDSFAFWFAAAALVSIAAFSTGKSFLRLKAVRLILKNYEKELDRQFWTQTTFWIVTPAVFFYNCLAALVSREIVWRGVRYRLVSPTETVAEKENTT